MFNPRTIFASLSLVLVLGLIYEWNSGSKSTKLERSVLVQNSAGASGYEKISNGSLDIYIDIDDGSIKEAYLYEKERGDGLVKTRLMSDDDLLKFYFKTSISGFRNDEPFKIKDKTSDSLVLVGSDPNNNTLEKVFYFEGPNVSKGLTIVWVWFLPLLATSRHLKLSTETRTSQLIMGFLSQETIWHTAQVMMFLMTNRLLL